MISLCINAAVRRFLREKFAFWLDVQKSEFYRSQVISVLYENERAMLFIAQSPRLLKKGCSDAHFFLGEPFLATFLAAFLAAFLGALLEAFSWWQWLWKGAFLTCLIYIDQC